MRKRRRILYQICGIFLGISCMMSACHEKEETFTSVAAAEADAGDKKNEAESKAAEEKPDKAKADPGGEEKEGSIWVYVCGEVASPGVYELQEGDRITHAIEAAGGLTEAAGQVYLNQAAHLTDGQRIYVPSREEEQTLKEEEAIIAYRETNGGFRKIEDLKKVDGIKEGIFQKIREQITVE